MPEDKQSGGTDSSSGSGSSSSSGPGPSSGLGSGGLGDLVKAESMIQLAIALPLGCLLGWLIGAWLDKHFHQTWMGVTGILLGAVGGFIQIFTTAQRYLKRGD